LILAINVTAIAFSLAFVLLVLTALHSARHDSSATPVELASPS
jgi:hypothetical protein